MNDNLLLNFPLYFKWTITSECNLRCKHCFLSLYNNKPDIDKIKNTIISMADKKIACICFTGGEPLLRDDLEEIVQTATDNNIKSSIATNGTLLTKERIDKLNQCGVFEYQISLDGVNEEANDFIRGKGSYNKAISAIKNLKKTNAKVILAVTLNKLNYMQMDDIVKLAEDLHIDLLRFEIFIPLGNGIKNVESLQLETSELHYIREKVFNLKSEKVKIQYPVLNSKYGCGAGYISCIINTDFSLSPCDMLANEIKTEPFTGIEHLAKLWKESKVFLDWKNIKINDQYCDECKHSDNCNYGCRAVSQAYNGNLNSSDKLCMHRKDI